MGLTVNKNYMTTEEIKLLLAATEKRIEEIRPEAEKLWAEFQALEAEVEKLSKPMHAARDAWSAVYTEGETLIKSKNRYALMLEQKGEATA